MTGQGHRRWAFAAGEVPVHSTGEEPEFTSRDELCVLNLGPVRAHVEVTVYHHDRDPVGPYRLEVDAERVCRRRINDLIDPEAVPLGQPFGLLVESDVPIVVQLQRLDTRQDALSSTIAHAFPLS
jgi:hypothetical protein